MLKTQTLIAVDHTNLNDIIRTVYGKPYDFQQQDDCKDRGSETVIVPAEPEDYENDTIPEVINGDKMGVSFKAWLARDPKEWNGATEDRHFLDLFWGRNFYPHISMILNDLHARKLIEAGTYTILIDW